MALILFKWFLASLLSTAPVKQVHPIFVSVTEIEHNAHERTLEISCKIFTDDFEKTLRKTNTQKIDLLDPNQKKAMNAVVNDYVQKHLKINVDGKAVKMNYIGFEQQEEGIISFFQVDNIVTVNELTVTDNILYEYQEQQLSLLHVTVNGNRKSTKLNNPEEKASFKF